MILQAEALTFLTGAPDLSAEKTELSPVGGVGLGFRV